MKIIYIHIEVTAREYLPKLLLSYLAAKKGYVVILGDILKFFSKNMNYNGIFHFKDIAPSKLNKDLFKKLKKRGFLITSIDEEGGIEYKNFDSKKNDSFLRLRFSDQTMCLIDKLFTWGEFDFESLKKTFKEHKYKIIKTGNPRYDFCNEKLDFFYNYGKNFYKSQNKKPILIISDLGYIMQEKPIWDQFKIFRDAYFQDNDLNEYEFELYEKYANKTLYLAELVKLTRKLVKKFPHEKFIFRPHPSESVEAWNKIIGEYKNLKITDEETSIYWIRNCKLIIHNSCYTSLEASILKKPIISFCPEQCQVHTKYFTSKIGLKSKNFQEVEKYLSLFLKKKNIFKQNIFKNLSIVKERMYVSNELSSNLILKEWNDISHKLDKKTKKEKISFYYYIFSLKFLFLIRKFTKEILKVFKFKFKIFSKFKEFNTITIKKDLKNLNNAFNHKNVFEVNQFDKNLCLIKTKKKFF